MEEEQSDDESGWETASDEDGAVEGGEGEEAMDQAEEGEWEDWDLCRSLFDNHVSPNLDISLEYMYRKYGFYLPDSAYLQDPEGLVKYLV